MAVRVDGALMCLTETKLGLIPATIGPYVIARMGEASARRVFMLSRQFSAQEAQQLGLFASVVPQDRLDSAVVAEVESYLSCALGTVTAAKSLVRFVGPEIDPQTIEMTISTLVTQWEGDAAGQGIAAFFVKTPPSWVDGDH
jgi:methylglutaconyl-CoA hydratase